MGLTQFSSSKQLPQADGFPLLGYAVYWSISDINVKYDSFVEMLESLGIPSEIATAVQTKSAVIKAIKSDTKGRKNSFHRSVVDNEAKASFAIVTSSTVDEANDDIAFHNETKVVLNKGSKTLEVTGPNSDEIKASFEAFKETYTSDRFRNVVLKLVKNYCQGMSIRERGGVYFIPSSHNDMFTKLESLFKMFPTCQLDVIPVIDTTQAKKSMWKTFVGEITTDIQRAKEDIKALDTDSSDRSLQVRLDRYEKLKDKVENYEMLLNGTATELKAELMSLGSEIRKKMVE
jgi:hypothetical protein